MGLGKGGNSPRLSSNFVYLTRASSAAAALRRVSNCLSVRIAVTNSPVGQFDLKGHDTFMSFLKLVLQILEISREPLMVGGHLYDFFLGHVLLAHDLFELPSVDLQFGTPGLC
jgi:hypothetical protein